MRSKRVYLLSVFYIAVLAAAFQWFYPETPVTAVATVVALLGFALALATHLAIKRFANPPGKTDG